MHCENCCEAKQKIHTHTDTDMWMIKMIDLDTVASARDDNNNDANRNNTHRTKGAFNLTAVSVCVALYECLDISGASGE